jgi:ubiquitin C-terminal hydrolase
LIGQYNPLFDDYAQHDSGELLVTALSSLSDDLNTVSKKQIYKIDPAIKRTDDELLA